MVPRGGLPAEGVALQICPRPSSWERCGRVRAKSEWTGEMGVRLGLWLDAGPPEPKSNQVT
eukprot:6707542-Pyramimonas_sp.AAC.1